MKTLHSLSVLITAVGASAGAFAASATVTTLIGTGVPGYSDTQVNNPYGLVIGPDGGLYFCDLDNQRIRRLDLRTKRLTTIAGNGQKGYTGDGGPAVEDLLDLLKDLELVIREHLKRLLGG